MENICGRFDDSVIITLSSMLFARIQKHTQENKHKNTDAQKLCYIPSATELLGDSKTVIAIIYLSENKKCKA